METKNEYSEELPIRVRAILGVPEEFLSDDVITSPIFDIKANKYITKKTEDYKNIDLDLIKIAYAYYICYLLCTGMYARLPKQMENVSTKTILESINWDAKAIEMLNMCNSIIDEAIEDLGEDINYGNTFIDISTASEYPNTLI